MRANINNVMPAEDSVPSCLEMLAMGFWSKLFGTRSGDNPSGPMASGQKKFEPTSTTNPNKAAALVMTGATTVPQLNQQELRQEFQDIKGAWACKELVEGDAQAIERVVAENLVRLCQRSGFRAFEVKTYPNQKCAQVSVMYLSSFLGVRIWRTASGYAVCGDPHFGARNTKGATLT